MHGHNINHNEILIDLVAMSNKHGSNPELVLAGGGNTSAKDDKTLYVKASGTSLASITKDGFVAMDRQKLNEVLKKDYPSNDKEREALFLEDVMGAKHNIDDPKRPSVEALLHNLFSQRFVLHLHPALVNGLTCGKDGESMTKRLFSDQAVWVEECRPGYTLAKLCSDKMDDYMDRTGKPVSVMLLQNHGVFFAHDTVEQVDELLNDVVSKLKEEVVREPKMSQTVVDEQSVTSISEILSANGKYVVKHSASTEAFAFSADRESASPMINPFTPDHIVYCKSHPVFIDNIENIPSTIETFYKEYGYKPKIAIVKGMGFFAFGEGEKEAETAKALFEDALKVAVYSESFGGPRHMAHDMVHFIENWEAESYRQAQNK